MLSIGRGPDKVDVDGDTWYNYNGRSVAYNCGYKDHKKALKRHVPKQCIKLFANLIKASPTWSNQNLANSRYINEAGLMQLVSQSRLRHSLIYAEKLGIDTFKFKTETAELATIDYIMTAFDGEDMIEQFVIGKYRVDLYFPVYKVAIECDENDHKGRDIDKETERQSFITEQLSCQWVRFNPHGDQFSIAKVTNAIFVAIKKA
jgi:very-short-patch-repair endonuclease